MVPLDILQERRTRKFRSKRYFWDQKGQISEDIYHAASRTIDWLAPKTLKCLSVNEVYAWQLFSRRRDLKLGLGVGMT